MRIPLVLAVLAIAGVARVPLRANQAGVQSSQNASDFEVASVKRNPGTPSGQMTFQVSAGGRLTARNMPLQLLIQQAYGLRPFQITGGPKWLDIERYDIDAKADGAIPAKEVEGRMLRALLEKRFGLKVRRESKEMPGFLLTQISAARPASSNPADCADVVPKTGDAGSVPLPCHEVLLTISPTGARLRGKQATTAQFVLTLANILGRPVIDKTAFPGEFDIDLEVSLDGLDGILERLGVRTATAIPPGDTTPSIFTALPQALGLKLTSGRGAVEMFVIEHVDRPTEN